MKVIGAAKPRAGAVRVQVQGLDPHAGESSSGDPRAAWSFSFDQLRDSGAFLALSMNGVPLPRDHGWPLRLLVPGWYGCACIKWVDRIVVEEREAPATEQMREFASRTHQTGTPKLAREYQPAAIDLTALPIRVEQRSVRGRMLYKVIGITWGARAGADSLMIRFGTDGEFTALEQVVEQPRSLWTPWSLSFRPPSPGTYRIELKCADATVSTRRLDRGDYVRSVRIVEV